MFPTKKFHSNHLVIFVLLFTCVIGFHFPFMNTMNVITTKQAKPNNSNLLEFSPNEGSYNADINWVNTTIDLTEKGLGTVRMIINCTPTEDHFGIYIRSLATGEMEEVIQGETFAINADQTLALNYSFVNDNELSFRIFIKEIELLNTSESIQYYFSYKANFFASKQIKHYEVDTDLIIINLLRPYWDGDLDFQSLDITLPIDVEHSNVTQTDLDEIKFSVADYMNDFYNITYKTRYDDGHYWLIFNCKKDSMLALGTFQAQFFVSIEYFSLPVAINWIIGLIVGIFVISSITLLIIVITVRKRTKKEIEEFESGLYKLIDTDES